MKDIEDKAIEYAYNNTALDLSPEMAIRAYIAGATEALQSQWHDASEPPKHDHRVFVKCEADTSDILEEYADEWCYTTASYIDGVWVFSDEYYYDVPVIAWMEISKYQKTSDNAD